MVVENLKIKYNIKMCIITQFLPSAYNNIILRRELLGSYTYRPHHAINGVFPPARLCIKIIMYDIIIPIPLPALW